MRCTLLVILLCISRSLDAQEIVEVQARVTSIAGQNVYVDAGQQEGLATNDTLDVYRESAMMGQMYVVTAASSQSVLGFLESPFALTIGDLLVLVPKRTEEPEAVVETDSTIVDRPSILTPEVVEGTDETAPSIAISGRLQIGVDGLLSTTTATPNTPSTDRTFATPFALFRGRVDNLPGGFSLESHFRTAYRYADPVPMSEEIDLRVYRFSLFKRFESLPLDIQAGRFYNQHDRFSGYWDGLNVHVGDESRGVGVSAGFQPESNNEVPSGNLPKYTVYGHTSMNTESLRYEGVVLGGQILPTNQNVSNRTYVGTHHRISSGGVRGSIQALVDQDPANNEWTLSRLSGRITGSLSSGIHLRAYAMSRRPYILLGDRQDLLDRSTRIGGGATVSPRIGSLRGLSLRADISSATSENQPTTMNYSGGLNVARIPMLDAGISLNATLWQQRERQGVYAGFGLFRSFGSTYTRVGYRYQQSPLFNQDDIVTHGLEALLQIPVSRNASFSVQASTNFSDRISSTRIYTALWHRL